MKAIVLEGNGIDHARYQEIDRPSIGSNDVCVLLKAAALNHRDIWNCDRFSAEEAPVILGSDGAGKVIDVGSEVDTSLIGEDVVINSSQDWADKANVPKGEYNDGYKILGYPDHGTFAEYIVIGNHQIEKKPSFLSWQEAAASCLVGITAYRALFTEGKLKEGQTVAIPGIGGGAATQALLFAKAIGAKVIVTSRSSDKLKNATELGADLAIPTSADWGEAVREFTQGSGADIIIETIGAATWKNSMAGLANGGQLIVFGATSGGIVELDLGYLFLHWQKIVGTTMGSRQEFKEMLDFTTTHKIKPVIDRVFALEDGNKALKYLESASQFGNVVLEIQK